MRGRARDAAPRAAEAVGLAVGIALAAAVLMLLSPVMAMAWAAGALEGRRSGWSRHRSSRAS